MKSSYTSSSYKNPSRKACEQIIKKILSRELEEQGTNKHFKQASDFMIYFESLYPASSSLTKQVQRAVSSLNLPRDENGYFMINKTAEEYECQRELSHLLRTSRLLRLDDCTPILIHTNTWKREHIIHLMESISELRSLYETAAETIDGIIIYTKTPDELTTCLSHLISI